MSVPFGQSVVEKAKELAGQGKDANQIAKIVFDQDGAGYNYGIGILLNNKGQAWPTSPTLLNRVRAELDNSVRGDYMNTTGLSGRLKEATLSWQRVPEQYWSQFSLMIPSDAGTGAVQSAIDMALVQHSALNRIAVEELSWPAYKVIARIARVGFSEFPIGGVMQETDTLPIYQAGPMNTTGRVQNAAVMTERARTASEKGMPVLLDRAYTGFEYARLIGTESYDTILRMSFETQIKPFIDAGVPFWLCISPTKAFVTFALRPCGMILYYQPPGSASSEATTLMNAIMRARGSSFEHPVSRAFARAMVEARSDLEAEHLAVLERLAVAESLWRNLTTNTPLGAYFSDDYAGLFRNVQVREGADAAIYDERLYPVFSSGRCRLNVTGIPADESIARRHVAVFSSHCY